MALGLWSSFQLGKCLPAIHLRPCSDRSVQMWLKMTPPLDKWLPWWHFLCGWGCFWSPQQCRPFFFDFVKKAKISFPRFRAQELVFGGMVEFLLLWDHTGTQKCLSPLFCKFTMAVHAVRDTFVHFTETCHLDFRQVPLLCPVICICSGKMSRGRLFLPFSVLEFWHLPSLGWEDKMGFPGGLLSKLVVSKNVWFLTSAPFSLVAPSRICLGDSGLGLWHGIGSRFLNFFFF